MMDKERYRWYKEHGICPGCGQNKAMDGHVYCVNCAEAQAVCQMTRRAKLMPEDLKKERQRDEKARRSLYYMRKEQGLCVQCGKPARIGKTRCKRCAEILNEHQRIRDRRK